MWTQNDWEKLGFSSFKDFIEAPQPSGGLDLSRSWAVELIHTYQKYVVELKQSEETLLKLSPRKLYFLKNQANKDNIKEILIKAETMTLTDLQIEHKNIDTVNCKHSNKETFNHCLDCNGWLKIND